MSIVFRNELRDAADPAARRVELEAEYREKFANPFKAAELGYIDEVIKPEETRSQDHPVARDAGEQARHQSAEEARQHPALRGPSDVQEGPDRQSRRDRGARDARLPRDGHQDGRRLLRRRPRRAARALRRRGVLHRPAARARVVPDRRAHRRGREAGRRRGDPPGLRLPLRARRVRRPVREGRRRLHRPARRGDALDGRQGHRAADDGARRRSDRAGHHRAAHRRGDRALGARRRSARDDQGGGRRRRQGHAARQERVGADRARSPARAPRRRAPSATTRSTSRSSSRSRATSRSRSSPTRTATASISSSASARSSAATRR